MFVDEAQVGVKTDSELVATLKAAKALIVDPENWIKGEYARDCYGFPIDPRADGAVSFCMIGALSRASGVFNSGLPKGHPILQLLFQVVDGNVPFFNDRPFRQHHEVMAAFDAAIVEAEKL